MVLRQLSRDDYAVVTHRSTGRKSLGKPLVRLLSVLMVSTKQASFHCSASGVEQDKHGCLAPPCGVVRGDHVVSPLWSTSELTVSDRSIARLGKLYGGTRHHHGYKRGMADARTSRVRERRSFLRFLSFTFRQAP